MADLAELRIKADLRDLKNVVIELDKTVKAGQRAEKSNDSLSKSYVNTNSAVSALTKGVIALGGVYLSAQGIAGVVRMADEYTMLNAKLQLTSDSTEGFKKNYQELFRVSQTTGTSFVNNAKNFANLSLALEDTNISSEETVKIFEAVNKSLVVAGASTEEASSFMLQFRQALGSGVLQGEEFRAMMESNSFFGLQLAKALDTDIAGLRAMSRQGELTTDIIRKAIPQMFEEIDAKFKALPITIQRATQELQNAFGDVINDANTTAQGTTSIADAIHELALTITENKETISAIFQGIINGAKLAVEGVGNVARSIQGLAIVAASEDKTLLDWVTASAEDMREWQKEIDNGTAFLKDRLVEVRQKIEETQASWGLWKDKKGILEALRNEEQNLLNQIELRNSAQNTLLKTEERVANLNKKETIPVNREIALSYDDIDKQLNEYFGSLDKLFDKEAEKLRLARENEKAINQQILALNGLEKAKTTEVDSWVRNEQLKTEYAKQEAQYRIDLENQEFEEKEKRIEEYKGLFTDAVGVMADAWVRGENVKMAISDLAANYLVERAQWLANMGLEAILTGKGTEIAAWLGLGTAESATDGTNWQQRLASAAAYFAGAAALIVGSKAIGNQFHADGGWIGSNPMGGMLRGGSGTRDDIFLGFTDGGATRNWGMGGEFVVNKESTAKFLPLLMAINDKKLANGGSVGNPLATTERINDAGFDTFWMSALTNKSWWAAARDTAIYYAGMGASVMGANKFGKNLFAEGGQVKDRGFLFGGIFDGFDKWFKKSDPWHFIPKEWGIGPWGIDPFIKPKVDDQLSFEMIWRLARQLPIVGESAKHADRILEPFIRDATTPGREVNFGTAKSTIKSIFEGIIDEIQAHLTAGIWSKGSLNPWKGILHSGIDYVPSTGTYLLQQGERVIPRKDNLQTFDKSSILHMMKYLKSIDDTLKKFDFDGLPASRGF